MMSTQRSGRGGLIWAIFGGAVLLAGIIAIIVTVVVSPTAPDSTPTPGSTAGSGGPTTAEPAPAGEYVDPAAVEQGWTPEPITTDPEVYIRAALETASTFDTARSSREEWLDYLDTWFTPDTRYPDTDQAARMKSAQVELRQGVVLPQEDWDSLAGENGRVVARTSGDIVLLSVAEDPSGDMAIGTADVTLTFTRSDDDGNESSYDEKVRVSVQVLCGPGSVPTPDTAQQAGDCKVVRYFTEPMEP